MKDYKKFVVHCEKSPYDIYIGRPSKFGNPFSHMNGTLAEYKVDSREEAIECYRNYVSATPWLLKAIKEELKDKILGCWCSPQLCHGEVLAEIANEEEMFDAEIFEDEEDLEPATIEDLEMERGERYIRVSITDEHLTQKDADLIYRFVESVVKNKKVPKIIFDESE